jgi:hypothetical protein
VIPETDDTITLALQECRAPLIIRILGVLAAISLDDQSVLLTDEVCDVRTDRLLPTELRSIQLTAAKHGPQLTLRICHLAPQLLRP